MGIFGVVEDGFGHTTAATSGALLKGKYIESYFYDQWWLFVYTSSFVYSRYFGICLSPLVSLCLHFPTGER